MLKSLSISNLAVISRLSVDFNEGLNLLTGETGAGKSIIVDAFGLLLGARATSDLVRTGESVAVVEGVFELNSEAEKEIQAKLAEVGVTQSDEEFLTVRREVNVSGRNRIFVNDRNVTLTTLKSLQPFLVEIHGQGEQRSLFDSRAQLRLLDAFAGCEGLREKLKGIYLRWRGLANSLESLRNDVRNRERTVELLRYQVEEIQRLQVQVGEDEALRNERRVLLNAERVSDLSGRAYSRLYDNDDSALASLASIRRDIQDLLVLDDRPSNLLESVGNAEVLLKDVAEELRRYKDGISYSADRVSWLEGRIAEIERMKRKYDCEADELNSVGAKLKARLEEFNNWSDREEALDEELSEVGREYAALASQLSSSRKNAVPLLERKVSDDLKLLAMEQARFSVKVETALDRSLGAELAEPDEASEGDYAASSARFWSPVGADHVEFWLTANAGESPRPLYRVASGGELSRLMLTLRTVCQRPAARGQETRHATLVFDEIDTGIGGRVAEAVGRRLKALAASQQVMCVTHQPQIARFADQHYAVTKEVVEGRTVAGVKKLTREERVGELARMIGADRDVKATRDAAKWLLESGEDASLTKEHREAGQIRKQRKLNRGK